SQEMAGLRTYKTITVKPLDFEDIPSVTAGSTTTVTIDGVEWYVLVKDNGKALLWAKDPVAEKQFHYTNPYTWQRSSLRTYLNGDWLNSTTILKEKAVQTDITTRSQYNATDWITTTDAVFLLSEADLFGTFNGTATSNAQDYTYGNSVIVPDQHMRAFSSGSFCWLRSPYNGSMAIVLNSGTLGSYSYSSSLGVRPALWVNLVS
ncbi:DUF6273 domain-containing protein, partial [Bianquea renquensis]